MSYKFIYEYDEEDQSAYINYATQKDIDNTIFPKNMLYLKIMGDHIDHIVVPDGVLHFTCGRVGLKTLHLPDSIEFFYVSNNLLKTIEIPQNAENAELQENYLESITFRGVDPVKLAILRLSDNDRLTTLDFQPPKTLEVIETHRCLTLRNVNKELQKIIDDNIYVPYPYMSFKKIL